MGARGPAPKPTALRLLQGVPGHRPLPEGEPKPKIPRTLVPPPGMSERAVAVWNRLTPEMLRTGLITEVDIAEFERFCELRATWEEARDHIKEHGAVMTLYKRDGTIKEICQNPSIKIIKQITGDLGRMADRFGLNPSARTRISVEKEERDDDLFEV